MTTEGIESLRIKDEQPTYMAAGTDPSLPHQCQAPRQNCTQPRMRKPDGSLHELCTLHRRKAQRTDQQRKRLLRILVDALKPENHDATAAAEATGTGRRRPRLVLLGNQQTLILGVVLSELGDLSGVARSML